MSKAQLIADFEQAMVAVDELVLQRSMEWAEGRIAALKALEASDKFKEVSKRGAWGGMYEMLFNVCGGKGWYQVFKRGDWKREVKKSCEYAAKKRNAQFAKKLEAVEVTKVESVEKAYTGDGFRGTFVLQTDKGIKSIDVDIIIAGGYNIQRLHNRTLIKVR